MPRADPADFAWLQDTAYEEAGCLTVVVGVDALTCQNLIGAEETTVPAAHSPDDSGATLVSFVAMDDDSRPTTLLIEQNGFEGARSEVLQVLARKGRAASAYWNVEGHLRFGCAQRGKDVVSVELDDIDADVPANLRFLLKTRDGADWPTRATALALVCEFTGVLLEATPEILSPRAAHRIISPISGLQVSEEELVRLEEPSAELVRAVLDTSSAGRWALADWALQRLLETGLLRKSQSASSFSVQTSRPRQLSAEMSAQRHVAGRALKQNPESSVAGSNYWAWECLAYLAQPSDTAAALGATYCARLAVGGFVDGEPFAEAALNWLRRRGIDGERPNQR